MVTLEKGVNMNVESKAVIMALKETWHRIDNLYDFYAKSAGVNFPTLLVLDLMGESGGSYTQKEICEKMDLPKQFINSIITSLWKQGYVRLVEAQDRRNKVIHITDEGKEYKASVFKPLEEAEATAWESFTPEEIANYASTTKKYAAAFEAALKRHQGK